MDVNHVVETMLHADRTPRFEQTVGPDQHVWIRTLRPPKEAHVSSFGQEAHDPRGRRHTWCGDHGPGAG